MSSKNDKFVFVHVPKTAGTTFIKLLDKIYKGRTARDYKDQKGNKNNYIRKKPWNKCNIIYGHFSSNKYKHLKRPQISFVRDPIERVISEYFYKANEAKNIRDYIKNKRIFAASEVKNINVINSYIIDIDRFKFIGLTERFDESLDRLEKIFDVKFPRYVIKSKENKKKKRISTKDREFIKKVCNKDYKIYNAVLAKWWQ
jgi:hypothetical protein